MRSISTTVLAAFVPLLAAACDAPVSDATADLDLPGYYEDEVWLVPFTELLVSVSSDDPELRDWSIETDFPLVALEEPFWFEGALLLRAHSGEPGDGALRVFDERGALVTDVPVFVRRPDQIALFTTADGLAYVPGPTLRVLEDESTRVSASYRFQGHWLGGGNQLQVISSRVNGASVDRGAVDAVEIAAPDAAYDLTLAAGDASMTTRIQPVAAAEATLALVTGESAVAPGGTAIASPRLRDREGNVVFASPGRWTLDGAPFAAYHAVVYAYDPSAPARELAVTFGGPRGELRAAATVHMSPQE